MRNRNPLMPFAFSLVLGTAVAPLAAQTSLEALTTQELYARARENAAKVNDRCGSSRIDYLEAMSYMFAYYQVASRDGSLKSDPQFDRNIRQQFTTVFRVARKCLQLPDNNARASMRDDGTGPVIVLPPVNSVDLPEPPPPGAGIVATDAQGRTIPQLLQEIEQLKQQREVFAAEVSRLRNAQPTPPPPPPPPSGPPNLSGEYRIQVVANNLLWHEDGNGDRRLSTRWQPNDDFTRFILELQADGSYRIRVKADGRYLHAPGHEDWIVSTIAQVDDDFTRFIIVPEADGRSFRLRQKATGRYLGLRPDGILTNNPQSDDNFMRFRLIR